MPGGKVNKNWIDLDFSSEDSLKASDIPYDTSRSIADVIAATASEYLVRSEYFTLSAADIANAYVVLENDPVTIDIQFVPMGGFPQRYQYDYVLVGTNVISWSAADCTTGLEAVLTAGDIIQITYNRGVPLI